MYQLRMKAIVSINVTPNTARVLVPNEAIFMGNLGMILPFHPRQSAND
jgi:hypothetical protein